MVKKVKGIKKVKKVKKKRPRSAWNKRKPNPNSVRQRVFKLVGDDRGLSVREICSKLDLDYSRRSHYVYNLKSYFINHPSRS